MLVILPGVAEPTVDIVFDSPWDRSMMSEAALLALGLWVVRPSGHPERVHRGARLRPPQR